MKRGNIRKLALLLITGLLLSILTLYQQKKFFYQDEAPQTLGESSTIQLTH